MSLRYTQNIILGLLLGIVARNLDSPLCLLPLTLFCLGLSFFCKKQGAPSWKESLCIGLIFNVVAFPWFPATFSDFLQAPKILSFLAAIVLWALASLRFVLFSFALSYFIRKRRKHSTFSLPNAWLLSVLFLPATLSWHLASPLIWTPLLSPIANVFGFSFLSWLLLWWSELIVSFSTSGSSKKRVDYTKGLLVSLSLVLAYGYFQNAKIDNDLESADRIHLTLIQTNLDPKRDFKDGNRKSNLKLHQELTRAALKEGNTDLIIWPESSHIEDIPKGLKKFKLSDYRDPFPELKKPLLFGGQILLSAGSVDQKPHYANSLILKTPDGRIAGRHEKEVLFPFGEKIPFQEYLPFLKVLNPRPYEINPGSSAQETIKLQLPKRDKKYSILSGICYEDLLASTMANHLSKEEPQLIVSVTNDAWFTNKLAKIQHHYVAAERAVEFKRFLVRATIDGLSGVVDPKGKTIAETPLETASFLRTSVSLLKGRTMYAQWGDGPLYVLVIFIIGIHRFKLRW